jgi:uncharacterized membrane protein
MKRFLIWLRTTFVSGLLAIIPVGVTVYILWALYRMIDGLFGRGAPIGQTVERAVGRWIPGLGVVLMLVIVIGVGVVVRNVLGRTLHYYFERMILAVPGIRKMYGTLKQFTGAVLDPKSTSAFNKVVMFEYPKPGINVIGLVTNEELGKLQDLTGEECILVYAPTTPNPLSGYMLIIPKRMVTVLDIPVEDALSMIVSSGSVLPKGFRTEEPPPEQEKRSRFHLRRKRQ